MPQRIETILLKGNSGSGKTTFIHNLVKKVQSTNCKIAGITAPGIFQNSCRHKFNVYDISTGKSMELAKRNMSSHITFGCFGFYEKGILFGTKAIEKAIQDKVDILVIDEVGPLELENKGWAPALQKVNESNIKRLLLTIRPEIENEVAGKFLCSHKILAIEIENAKQIFDYWNI